LPTQASAVEVVGAHTGIVSMWPLSVLAGAEQSTDRWLTGRTPVYPPGSVADPSLGTGR
jgi:hypothetical protein